MENGFFNNVCRYFKFYSLNVLQNLQNDIHIDRIVKFHEDNAYIATTTEVDENTRDLLATTPDSADKLSSELPDKVSEDET